MIPVRLSEKKSAPLAARTVFLAIRRFDEMVPSTSAPRDTMNTRPTILVAAGRLVGRQVSMHSSLAAADTRSDQ